MFPNSESFVKQIPLKMNHPFGGTALKSKILERVEMKIKTPGFHLILFFFFFLLIA